MAGGGDGGMSLGGDGGGGGKGGGSGGGDTSGMSGDSQFSGDPSLGGDSSGGGFPGMDSGNAYTDQPFSGSGSSGDTAQSDPNIGVPQSLAPTPGTTTTSIGGNQGGPQQGQGFGGGSPTQQGQPQFTDMIQKAVKQLQGGGQQSGQQNGGTAGPSNITPTLDQLAKGGQGFGGGSPTQQATNQTQLMSTLVPTTSVSPDQQPTGAIPGSQPTAPPPAPAAPPGGQAGPTGPGATPAPQELAAATAMPRDPNAPAPDFSPKTGETTPESATGSPSGSGGQPSGGGGARGGGGAQPGAGAGTANPLKLFGDAIQALMGNPGPLLQDLAGQQNGAAPQGYDPTTGKPYAGGGRRQGAASSQGTAPATAPTGSEELSQKPGGPDNPRVDPNDEQGKRRADWYKTHDRTDPFPEDTYTPQGPTKEGGTLAGPGSQPGGVTNWQELARMSPAQQLQTHAQNFNQPYNSNLAQERQQRFARELQDPRVRQRVLQIAGNEQSSHPQGTQAVIESLMNRASVSGRSLWQEAQWYQQGGYYDRGGGGGDPRVLNQSLQNAMRGSNISNYATDNASNTPTANAREGLARREVQTGRFHNQSQYGGEWFQSPGSSGNFPRAQWQQWMNRMNGGGQQQTPTTPQPAPPPGPPRAMVQPPQQNMASMMGMDWV